MDHAIMYRVSMVFTRLSSALFKDEQTYCMETRMTTLETRFDTILPTLATKEDLKIFEVKLTLNSKEDIKNLEHTIHNEISSIRKEMISNNWRMMIWMSSVIGMALTFLRYAPH